jgi:2-keto-4-pentenoate hydratase
MDTRRADAEFDVDDLNNDAIATELLAALDHTALIAPITTQVPGFGAENAYDVSAQLALRRRARGERSIGRKLGFTNRTIWPQYGIDSPIWAFLYDKTVTFLDATPGPVTIGHLAQPRLEPEIVLHFRSAPPITTDEEELLTHVDWIAHGFEIVQCHFPDWTFQTADAISDFGLHGALVVGPKRSVSDLSDPVATLRTFTIALSRDGEVQTRGGGANVLGSPLSAVVDLCSKLKNQPRFEPIRPGEIVTTGTLTTPVAVNAGQTWSTALSGIDLDGLRVQFQ